MLFGLLLAILICVTVLLISKEFIIMYENNYNTVIFGNLALSHLHSLGR